MPSTSLLSQLQQAGPATLSIFLSSTVRDYAAYRRRLKKLLSSYSMSVFLGEDWAGGADNVLRLCKDQLGRSDTYLLLLGHWYGSIPPNSEESVTHQELKWARDKWPEASDSGMAIYRPKPLSKADRYLRAKAMSLLPSLGEDRRLHDQRLERFYRELDWTFIQDFKDELELQQRVLAFCSQRKGWTFAAAARGLVRVERGTRLTEEDLGLLGRKAQLDAAQDLLTELTSDPAVPALCFLVSGDEDSGQRQLLARLQRLDSLARSRPARSNRLVQERYDIALLVSWAARFLGLDAAGVETPEGLADRIALKLRKQPLVLALDAVDRLTGGVATFQQDFWQPLFHRLRETRATQPSLHHLFAIVTDYTTESEAWGAAVSGPTFDTEPPDPARLLLLPRLTEITKIDVLRWLAAMDVPDSPPGRWQDLARIVLLDREKRPDPTPIQVFNRLQAENLWPEE